MKKILVTLATLVMSATIALAGAPTAKANDDGLCWNGWLWTACVQGPGWVDWNPVGQLGPREQQTLEPRPRPLEVRQIRPLRCRRG